MRSINEEKEDIEGICKGLWTKLSGGRDCAPSSKPDIRFNDQFVINDTAGSKTTDLSLDDSRMQLERGEGEERNEHEEQGKRKGSI